ncbi:MAG: hypothetical protein V3S21_09835 [Xanthomonadales bacterium]
MHSGFSEPGGLEGIFQRIGENTKSSAWVKRFCSGVVTSRDLTGQAGQ